MFNRKVRSPCHRLRPLIPPSSPPSWIPLGQRRRLKVWHLLIELLSLNFIKLPDAAGAAAPPAGAAPTPDPMLVIKFLTSTPSRALANKLGQ